MTYIISAIVNGKIQPLLSVNSQTLGSGGVKGTWSRGRRLLPLQKCPLVAGSAAYEGQKGRPAGDSAGGDGCETPLWAEEQGPAAWETEMMLRFSVSGVQV